MSLRNVIASWSGGVLVPPVPSALFPTEPAKPAPRLAVPSVPPVPPEKTTSQQKNKLATLAMMRKPAPEPPTTPATARAGQPPDDASLLAVEAQAQALAAEFGTTAGFCLGLLDGDDRRAIATGSDPGRAVCWRGFIALAVARGEAPQAAKVEALGPAAGKAQGSKPVRCRDCRHATPAQHPALFDCAAEVPAPGACGPFRRWADDEHLCHRYEERP